MKLGMNTDFSNLSNMPLGLWILLALILFTQAIWLFMDASKRNANKWLWGIWGLIQAPTPLILYLLIVQKILSRNNRAKRIKTILFALGIIIFVILLAIGIIFYE